MSWYIVAPFAESSDVLEYFSRLYIHDFYVTAIIE